MKQKLLALFLVLSLILGGCGLPQGTSPDTSPSLSGEMLFVHFIDVGQADCALIQCGEFTMLIDGGNKDDGRKIVAYLQEQGVEELDVVVATHAHEDHIGGLPAVLAVFPTAAVYSPTKTYSSDIFDSFLYYVDQQGLEVTFPEPGGGFTMEGVTITFLGPLKSYPETNDTSIVLRIDYGETSFLFTGDAETVAEQDMMEAGMDLQADVLKVGHHCSNTSTSYRFLSEVDPTYAVISCGKDNSYGHPHEAPFSRLQQAECVIFRTDQMGTILATSNGTDIAFTWENQDAEPENAEGESIFQLKLYIGNANSQVFHDPSCGNLPSEKNRVYFYSWFSAQLAGYTPCSSCLPDR